ncbi:MAG: M16 family metallopeptidase [Flavonifractor plautii]
MVSKEYPRIGEKIYHAELPNGLHIYVDRRPEFQKSYAFFATNYGGMDMKFHLDGQWRDTPAGVAHFLEHKMFDTEDGNALQDLAANGASPNAFTSSALTGYYFESTEKFCDNLKILLSFVSIPWFTQESVDKEQGIIGQEIRMVEDDPDNQVFYGLMECLFDHHPIRCPSPAQGPSPPHRRHPLCLPQGVLHPLNMVLTVAGDVEPEEVVRIAREILPKEPGGHIERDYGGEEDGGAAAPERSCAWRCPPPSSNWASRPSPPPPGRSTCAASSWASWPASAAGPSSPCMPGSTARPHQQELWLRL